MAFGAGLGVRLADRAGIAAGAALLRSGGLVAFPTETVYGLGGDATSDKAVASVFEAKGRPTFNPLIVHVADVTSAATVARFDARARSVAARFWPGPLTLVLPRHDESPVSLLASAGLDTVAVRVPEHALARAFLRACGRPVVAPSANRSGRISPTDAAHVVAELGDRIDMVLDGGACPIGVESTVLDLASSEPRLLRHGGVELEALREMLHVADGAAEPEGDAARPSPGMLSSHYAPRLPVRLEARDAAPDEALLGFGPMPATRNLSVAADLAEAAASLFRLLRELDDPRWRRIAVAPIPERGLGRAINDRLRRAAAPRDRTT